MTDAPPSDSHPDWLAHVLEHAPRKPGCYLMKDRAGAIVYVGKAQDLRARLGQYFQPGTSDTRFFVALLDRVLGAIDLIVAQNAKEALLLENELIKRHQPRFNVKLKDDKNFLNLRIGYEHAFPRLQVVRRRKRDGADYFGPYHAASAIRATLKVVNRHFQLRTCRDTDFARRTRPCLEHQIGRCPAPCVLPIAPADYAKNIDDAKLFLAGRGEALLARLRGHMSAASNDLAFELAARYRDQIDAIERSLEPQKVILAERLDIDAIGFAREAEAVVFQVLQLRGGVLVGSHPYPVGRSSLPDHALLDGFLSAYFAREERGALARDDLERAEGDALTRPVPDLVLLPLPLDGASVWEELLTESKGRRVEVRCPERGDKRRVLELAIENASTTLRQRQRSDGEHVETLSGLQQRLHLPRLPRRIECFDISNIQGTNPVGSMVVALDGVMTPRAYRTFKVKGLATPNDFAMMLEVLGRRFKRVRGDAGVPDAAPHGPDAFGEAPDLILVDGGKGQLAMAQEALRTIGVQNIELAALAKSRVLDEQGHVARGRGARAKPSSDDVDRSPERVFRPGQKNAIVLRANSNELFLLQRLRDEAHRFAIEFHRRLRRRRTLTSALDAIPGIGPARRKALLTHFGSVAKVRAATIDELMAVPGMANAVAERLVAFFAASTPG